jgi:hypothetical protein
MDEPEALRLADELDGIPLADMTEALADDAAAELRRLHALNGELLEALKLAVRQNEHDMLMTGEELRNARAAIARAKGEKT